MRNLITPTITDIGTITRAGGQTYAMQTISYGSRHHIHVFRKGELHKRGMVFTNSAAFEQWKKAVRQGLLFDENSHQQ